MTPRRRIAHRAVSILARLALAGLCLGAVQSEAVADSLQDYAQQCTAATQTTIADFDCDAGTEVPVTHAHGSDCDEPNRLNQVCDPGSHFTVLTRSADAYVVAHCRKKGNSAGEYGDIAIIQYNRNNGATCFYQALGTLPGKVKSPNAGMSAWPWISPTGTAGIGCGGCHDNGPFIRSPYLNQVKGPNALPGSDDFGFNSTQPYAFVGQDFASWKAFRVEVAGNECISCHRLGVNNVRSGEGTGIDFDMRAVSATESSKNPPSADSPIWMPPAPVQTSPNAMHQASAKAIHDCAIRMAQGPLPDTDACRIVQYAGAFTAAPSDDGSRYAAIWTKPGQAPFIAHHDMTSSAYQAEFDKHGPDGFCLVDVSGYEVDGDARYAAIWEKKTCPPVIARHGLTAQEYQQEFDKHGQDGFRLTLVDGYTVKGQDRYAAIWEKASGPELVARHGLTAQQYQQQFDQMNAQNFCLSVVSGYAVGNDDRYAGIWEKKTCPPTIARHGLTAQEYQQEFDKHGQDGFRLELVSAHKVGGHDSFAAIWRKEPGPAFVARHGLSSHDYQAAFDQLVQQGFSLVLVSGY